MSVTGWPLRTEDDLEQTWNEKPPACELVWGNNPQPCGKQARWIWKINCECGVRRTWLACQECKDRVTSNNLTRHTNGGCEAKIQMTWIPL